ncbi:uncharacterized protein BT62DRAFT_989922 [Guyanagaster necrorhizus]|uniref:AB hydrolase-1 domain-containing protein n=1 Tax=Guyanagaster necrorhizus TaxID=856835 RepID=A0A9P8AYQ7_9AGAR|nr:uncharacterized protein BT62DRAFT_989922 [Guyanagaster necrorhizus MCA 3950]KAG7452898.1 hypothetical protein BT62DRAFT_989922 [Guyanagaster necrorhizus MCA 3950]
MVRCSVYSFAVFCFASAMSAYADGQSAFTSESRWNVEVSKHWDVLGPFPIQAREQHFISPSFPLNLSEPIDLDKTWPSSYANGGRVTWSFAILEDNGELEISFPDIRWESLRATEGWAALQHHAVLRSTLTVHPPLNPSKSTPVPRLLVQLIQGSYFTILPKSGRREPRWYSGNIYAMERALPQEVPLPTTPSNDSATQYDIFLSGDYEIRLFGDPHSQGRKIPVQSISISVKFDDALASVVRESTQDVVCNFVDSFAFGDAIGIGLRSVHGWWTVTNVSTDPSSGLFLTLVRPTRIVEGQTRIVPVRITQTRPFSQASIDLKLTLTSGASEIVTIESLPVDQLSGWTESVYSPIKGTYFYARSMPTVFTALPPRYSGPPKPPILALHGAGVDIVEQPFWADALPRNSYSWFVIPTGRTSWGLDWHGPSTKDAWASLYALATILAANRAWLPWKLDQNIPVIVLGHSNGGQGAWYVASRYPDRVLGIIPAAAYIKSQSYVPLTLSRSARFIDPILLSILETSLTPDNNDLFLTNLVDTPVLAVHGGNDDNVPVWHSRESAGILENWNPAANVAYREDAGQGHWYSTVFNNTQVTAFIDDLIASYPAAIISSSKFMLTVSIPAESGSLHGWRIVALTIPGRLGRLRVERASDLAVRVYTSNLQRFSVDTTIYNTSNVYIDNSKVYIDKDKAGIIHFEAVEPKVWKTSTQSGTQLSGRMQTVLSSNGPLVLVIPDDTDTYRQEFSVAQRIAHDLGLYHRLDTEIIRSSEASDAEFLSQGNIVAIGNEASASFVVNEKIPFEAKTSQHLISYEPQQPLDGPEIGLLFLHSHPLKVDGNMVMMQSTDAAGLERVARLFPIRTGILVPDWLIVGPLADSQGAGGVISAGLWGSDWSWNDPMSWTS